MSQYAVVPLKKKCSPVPAQMKCQGLLRINSQKFLADGHQLPERFLWQFSQIPLDKLERVLVAPGLHRHEPYAEDATVI